MIAIERSETCCRWRICCLFQNWSFTFLIGVMICVLSICFMKWKICLIWPPDSFSKMMEILLKSSKKFSRNYSLQFSSEKTCSTVIFYGYKHNSLLFEENPWLSRLSYLVERLLLYGRSDRSFARSASSWQVVLSSFFKIRDKILNSVRIRWATLLRNIQNNTKCSDCGFNAFHKGRKIVSGEKCKKPSSAEGLKETKSL